MYRLNTEKYCRLSSGRARRGLLPMELQGCREARQMPRAQAHDKVPGGAAHQPGAGSGGAEDPGYSAQVFPLRARCLGVSALQRKDRLSALERGEAAIQGTPLFSDRTFTSHMGKPVLGAQPLPAGVRELQSQSLQSLQSLRLSREGCRRRALFLPVLPPGEGWALQQREAPSLFGDTYQGSCCCCSCRSRFASATILNILCWWRCGSNLSKTWSARGERRLQQQEKGIPQPLSDTPSASPLSQTLHPCGATCTHPFNL